MVNSEYYEVTDVNQGFLSFELSDKFPCDVLPAQGNTTLNTEPISQYPSLPNLCVRRVHLFCEGQPFGFPANDAGIHVINFLKVQLLE